MVVSELALWHIGLLLLGVAISCELMLRLPLRARVVDLRQLVQRILRTISSPKISDHWKERVMLVYAGRLLGLSLLLPLLLLVALTPLASSMWLASASLEDMLALGLAPDFLVGVTLFALAYIYLRSRQHA